MSSPRFMTAVAASRIVFGLAIVATLGLMLVALAPFGHHSDGGSFLMSLLLFPFLAIWAVGPYAVANKFAGEDEDATAWVYVAVQIVVGLPVCAIYLDAYVLTEKPDAQSGLVFAIFPVYQFIAVLAAYYGVRLWRRFNPSGSA